MEPPASRPWIIAHRGASRAQRENTLGAFRAAAVMGADAVELDVRRTVEGVLVVHHDDRIEGMGPIAETTLDDLDRAAPWVPTFEDAMAACSEMWVNVEIKNSPFEAGFDPTDSILADVIASTGPDTLISSFNPLTMHRAVEGGIPQRTGYLLLEGTDPLLGIEQARGHDTVHIAGEDLIDAAAVVTAAEESGLQVIAWTVDDPATMMRLAEAGVAGIITNVPDVAAEVLGA